MIGRTNRYGERVTPLTSSTVVGSNVEIAGCGKGCRVTPHPSLGCRKVPHSRRSITHRSRLCVLIEKMITLAEEFPPIQK